MQNWPCDLVRHFHHPALDRLHMPISCHFGDCKSLLITSPTHHCSAVSSFVTFTWRSMLLAVTLQRCRGTTLITRILQTAGTNRGRTGRTCPNEAVAAVGIWGSVLEHQRC